MVGQRIYIAATNDLLIDQRVHRTAITLMESGAVPVVIGLRRPGSQPLPQRPYPTHRLRPVFQRGFLFYLGVNLRLFCYLLFSKAGTLVSNDLDTLPAMFLVARIRNKKLVFDSHEYFTELPELVGRRFVRRVWETLEGNLLPRIRHGYTVCRPIADAYHEKYGITLAVVRNLPLAWQGPDAGEDGSYLPSDVIIYQGAVNVGRGLESMIRAMAYLEKYRLQIYGDGTITGDLLRLRDSLALGDRVEFMGRIPFEELRSRTREAALGISLEENLGLNYYYALPNKLFDYIQARVPVLVSDLPEMSRIVTDYGVGQVLRDREPEKLAVQVNEMLSSAEMRKEWSRNLQVAAAELCWEKEAEKLREVYREVGITFPSTPRSHG
jgi:glycosyltransferase involved in cell wall biosynthesis